MPTPSEYRPTTNNPKYRTFSARRGYYDAEGKLIYEFSEDKIKQEFSFLFAIISRASTLDFVEYNGHEIRQGTDLVYDRKNPDTDSDSESVNYEESDFEDEIPSDQFKYIIGWDLSGDEIEYVIEYLLNDSDYQEEYVINKVEHYIDMIKTNKKILPNITLHNLAGYNSDKRGSDRTCPVLDFSTTYKVEGNTITDLAEAYYRVKSHKFDNWYEMFMKVVEVNKNQDTFDVYIDFDHGS